LIYNTGHGEIWAATNSSSQQASVQRQHARHASRKAFGRQNREPSITPAPRSRHQQISFYSTISNTFEHGTVNEKRGENPRCHLQPYLIQRPLSHLLHSKAARNNCLHTYGNLQANQVRECRHRQQTPTRISHNQTQCNSGATETCQKSSRPRYPTINTVGAIFRHNTIQTTQRVPSPIRSIVRRLRIIRLVRDTDNALHVPQTSGIDGGSCLSFTASPPAHGSNQQPKSTSQAHNPIHNSSQRIECAAQGRTLGSHSSPRLGPQSQANNSRPTTQTRQLKTET
jgi:hypothetical protein